MPKFWLVILIVCGILAVLVAAYLLWIKPWYWNWGATQAEIHATLPGDELVSAPDFTYTRAITIHATPEEIYPWLAQMGQGRGGLYSILWIENLIGCEMENADTIHPEWQNIQPGDPVRMGPDDKPMPPAYLVAQIVPNRALVLGHHPNLTGEGWSDTWQFVLQAVDAQNTRLLIRSRGFFWGFPGDQIIQPGTFIMEHAMLNGIKERAERD